MLQHLLVISTSDTSDDLIRQASNFARRLNAKLTLLRQITFVHEESQDVVVDPLDWHIRLAETKAKLQQHANKFVDEDFEIHTDILETANVQELVTYAEMHDVDMIMLVKQTDNLNDLMHNVIKNCNIPLLVLDQDYIATARKDCFQKIIVPLDGSQRSENVLPMASYITQICQGSLVLAHVVQKPEMPRRAPPSDAEVQLVQQFVETNRQQIHDYLTNTASRLPGEVSIRIVINDNALTSLQNIIREEDADILVMSAHGYTGDPQQPIGRVARSLLSACPIPVLAVQDLTIHRSTSNPNDNIPRQAKVR